MSEPRERIDAEISDALDGRLSESEERAFRARCAADPELARAWEAQRQIRETLRQLGTEPAPPELAGRLALELRSPEGLARTDFPPRSGLRLALLRAAAAVILLVGAVTTWSVMFREDTPAAPQTNLAEGSDAAFRLEGGAQRPSAAAPTEKSADGLGLDEESETISEDEMSEDQAVRAQIATLRKVATSHLTTEDPAHALYQRRTRESLRDRVESRIRDASREARRRSGGETSDAAAFASALLLEADSVPDELHDALLADAGRSLTGYEPARDKTERDASPGRPVKEARARSDERFKGSRGGVRPGERGAKKAEAPSGSSQGRRARATGAREAAPPAPVTAPGSPVGTAGPKSGRGSGNAVSPAAGFYLISNGRSGEVVSRSLAALPADAVRELHLDTAARPDAKVAGDQAPKLGAVAAPSEPRYRIYQLTLAPADANRLVSDLETELGSKLRAVGQGTLPRTALPTTRDGEIDGTLRVLRLVVTTSD